MASLQTIAKAVRDAINDVGAGTVYDSYASPNLTDDDFPIVVFRMAPIGVGTSFGSSAADDIAGIIGVRHFTLVPEGPNAVRAIMEKTYAALHRQSLTADGWSYVQLRCVTRGPIEAPGAGMLSQLDQYEIRAEES